MKILPVILIATGIASLFATILLAFSTGGAIVPVLLAASILLNAVGITFLRGKK